MMIGTKKGKLSRTRARRPKVKTGCQTCKTRRLKCDETRPSCLRCIKFGTQCDFYLAEEPKSKAICSPITKPLAPKPTSTQVIFHPPCKNMFNDEQERRAFQFFSEKTAHGLSGCFDLALWRLVLQACERDPSICHAVIAIGALDVTSKRMKTRSQHDLKACEQAEQDHHFALQQYGIAIRGMRESATTKKMDIRTTLIGCILLTCFETFHGNHQTAIAQIQSGLSLVEEWHSKITTNSDHLLGTSSPSPYIIEDEIFQAFGRLDLQSLTFLDPRSKKIHERMKTYGQASLDAMQPIFSTLSEARVYCELVLRRVMHFVISISKVDGNDGVMKLTDPQPVLPEPILAEQKRYMQDLQRWYRAFKPLLEAARKAEDKRDFLAATSLEAAYLCGFFGLDSMTLGPRSAERSTFFFDQIVSRCKTIVEHDDTRSTEVIYAFDLNIVVPLYITGLRCRHSPTRRQAIAILLSSPRREGVWDAVMAGKILGWILDIEEEDGLDGEFMIKGRGIVNLEFDFDLQNRSVHLHCLQLKSGSDVFVEREETITW